MAKRYEAMFILPAALDEQAAQKCVEQIQDEIKKLKGAIEGMRSPEKRPFARPMRKKEGGWYVKVDFEIDPAQMAALQGRLKLNENIFRSQIVCCEKPAPTGGRTGAAKTEATDHGVAEQSVPDRKPDTGS